MVVKATGKRLMKGRGPLARVPARSVLVVLMRDVRGTPLEKLALLDTLKAAGRLSTHGPQEVAFCENALKALAALSAAAS